MLYTNIFTFAVLISAFFTMQACTKFNPLQENSTSHFMTSMSITGESKISDSARMRYFGYYKDDGYWSDMADHVNLHWVSASTGESDIDYIKKNNKRVVWMLSRSGSAGKCDVSPDQTTWDADVSIIKANGLEDYIAMFDLGDEPVATDTTCGSSRVMEILNTVSKMIHTTFPGKKTWYNDYCGTFMQVGLVPDVDYFSFDCYNGWDSQTGDSTSNITSSPSFLFSQLQSMVTSLIQNDGRDRKIILVPGGYVAQSTLDTYYSGDRDQFAAASNAVVEKYFNAATANSMVIGIIAFEYNGARDNFYGIKDISSELNFYRSQAQSYLSGIVQLPVPYESGSVTCTLVKPDNCSIWSNYYGASYTTESYSSQDACLQRAFDVADWCNTTGTVQVYAKHTDGTSVGFFFSNGTGTFKYYDADGNELAAAPTPTPTPVSTEDLKYNTNRLLGQEVKVFPDAPECGGVICAANTNCDTGWVKTSTNDGGRWCRAVTTDYGGAFCQSKRSDGSCPGSNCNLCKGAVSLNSGLDISLVSPDNDCRGVYCSLNQDCSKDWTKVSTNDGGRQCSIQTSKSGSYSCQLKRDDGTCPSSNCSACTGIIDLDLISDYPLPTHTVHWVEVANINECSSLHCEANTDCSTGWVLVSSVDGGRWCNVQTTKDGSQTCQAKRTDGSCPGSSCSSCKVVDAQEIGPAPTATPVPTATPNPTSTPIPTATPTPSSTPSSDQIKCQVVQPDYCPIWSTYYGSNVATEYYGSKDACFARAQSFAGWCQTTGAVQIYAVESSGNYHLAVWQNGGWTYGTYVTVISTSTPTPSPVPTATPTPTATPVPTTPTPTPTPSSDLIKCQVVQPDYCPIWSYYYSSNVATEYYGSKDVCFARAQSFAGWCQTTGAVQIYAVEPSGNYHFAIWQNGGWTYGTYVSVK